jgi:hypothetical protein
MASQALNVFLTSANLLQSLVFVFSYHSSSGFALNGKRDINSLTAGLVPLDKFEFIFNLNFSLVETAKQARVMLGTKYMKNRMTIQKCK